MTTTIVPTTVQPTWTSVATHLDSARTILANGTWIQDRCALPHGAAHGLDGALFASASLLDEQGYPRDPQSRGECARWVAVEDAAASLCRALPDHVCRHNNARACLCHVTEWAGEGGRTKAEVLALLDAAMAAAAREQRAGVE